jgi:hypothetical protein
VTFPPQEEEEKDLVHLGICQLVKVKGEYRWKLSEPLAIRVAHEVLNAVAGMDGPKTVLFEARNNLYEILFKLGPKASAKGDFGELLAFSQMMQSNWQNKPLAELDVVVQNMHNIPAWMRKIKFKLNRYGTAQQLGFGDDLEYFTALCNDNPLAINTMLLPEKTMRPDGVLLYKRYVRILSDQKFDEELLEKVDTKEECKVTWFAITLGSKIYSGPIKMEDHESNINSTDLTKAYFQKDGTTVQRAKVNTHKRFHEIFKDVFSGSLNSLGGMLRLHVELPYVKTGGTSTIRSLGLEKTVRDVAIHIDASNIRTMFLEDETLEVLEMATSYKFIIPDDVD